jgi:hypothetical protein
MGCRHSQVVQPCGVAALPPSQSPKDGDVADKCAGNILDEPRPSAGLSSGPKRVDVEVVNGATVRLTPEAVPPAGSPLSLSCREMIQMFHAWSASGFMLSADKGEFS